MIKEQALRYLKGVGPRREAVFKRIGVNNVRDLLYYFPYRYEDRRFFKTINCLKEGEPALVKGKVLAKNLKKIPYFVRTKKVRSIFEIVLADRTGKVSCLWFNQAYLAGLIGLGQEIIVYGKPSYSKGKLKFNSPEYEIIKKEDSLSPGRITGVYRLGGDLSQKFIRRTISSLVSDCKAKCSDPIPFYIRKEKNILNIAKSLEEMHFPSNWEKAKAARRRFIFEELFYAQILVYLRKAKYRLEKGVAFVAGQALFVRIKKNLNFSLTFSQEEAITQLARDLAKPYPMHRLLQGDVGCGKTVVAAFALGICAANRSQAALMVPTEVLACQHKENLEKIFKGMRFKVEVLVSSLPGQRLKRIYQGLKEGKIDIVVGTHALIQEKVVFRKLGLVVIDEQHRFGVAQRALLPRKGKNNPHYLVMSATPIPRSLALSLYGDLDLSVIKEMPKGRLLPETILVKEKRREWVYRFLKERLREGRQAYIIYPLIEESGDGDLKSLQSERLKIAAEFFPFKAGVFHGRMKAQEKLAVINDFRENKINILICTTIVEVGVNIENATVMVVENPERFGLAQLHQLRGRIQRSNNQPYFILLSKEKLSPKTSQRLKIISNLSDGFKVAEEDLTLRGPGDFFGVSQHGLPELKIADPLRDLEILNQARISAYRVIKGDPSLDRPLHRCIKEHLSFWFKR